MRKFKYILKKTMITLGILIALLVLTVAIFINVSPQFGASISKEQKAAFANSKNYHDGKFNNLGNVEMSMGFKKMSKALIKFVSSHPNTIPVNAIPVQETDASSIAQYAGPTRFIWFGHSTFLLQINGKNILIDPMFSDVPAPHPMLGTKRFSKKLPIQIEALPHIDAVILSHDHYDHLDYGSIISLKDKVNTFYTPLGVGSHLQEWGIPSQRIVEMDWYDEVVLDDLVFKCTPAQHFSGRGLTDRAATLWSSWILKSPTENIFFSGDSGYGSHFKEIGDKYGPFDMALIECGQYDVMWQEIHMMPEQTAKAAMDLKAKAMMPIHWGAFKLATHEWNEPVKRLSESIKHSEITLVIPIIGESVQLINLKPNTSSWWQ